MQANSPQESTDATLLLHPQPQRTNTRRSSRLALKTQIVVGPQTYSYDAWNKTSWELPACTSKVMILGDSNLSRIGKVDSPKNSVEIHAYSGAKPIHFNKLLTTIEPRTKPSTVILSIGVNSRDSHPKTTRDQMTTMVQSASKTFPKAQIFIPQINISPSLPANQRVHLDLLNTLIVELSGQFPKINTIPKLPQDKFHTEGVHWQTKTADDMISHWFQHLNQ